MILDLNNSELALVVAALACSGAYAWLNKRYLRKPSDGGSSHSAIAERVSRKVVRDLTRLHREPDVQQFIADVVSVLSVWPKYWPGTKKMPLLRHAFPISDWTKEAQQATTKRLSTSLKRCSKEIGISERLIEQRIREELTHVLRSRREIHLRHVPRNLVSVREGLLEISTIYPSFHGSHHEPTSPEVLVSILRQEGLSFYRNDDLAVLSACIGHESVGASELSFAILVKDSLHPALEAFLIGHELGHWWLHLRRGAVKDFNCAHNVHSMFEWGPRELEADKVAVTALFSTPYVMWLDVEGDLTEERLLADVKKKWPHHELSDELERSILEYASLRISGYRSFGKFLEVDLLSFKRRRGRVEESELGEFTYLLEKEGYSWAQLGTEEEGYPLVACGNKWAALFGVSADDLVGRPERQLSILKDFTVDDDILREKVLRQLKLKRDQLSPTMFVTAYRNPLVPTAPPVQVLLKTYPIVKNGKYTGSLGVAEKYPIADA